MKRANSPGTTRLTAHISPFNSSVTLFKPEDTTAAGPSTPRRSKRVKLEDASISKIADLEDTIEEQNKPRPRSQTKSKSKSKATTSKGKVKPIQQFLETPHPAPPRWKETYETIKEMRSHIVAPVDTMGCDQAQLKETVPKNQRFSTLVSLMLSSQTKDEVTDAAVSKLRNAVGGSLSVAAIIEADDDVISDAIGKVGFWRRKTQYIKETAKQLRADFGEDVPRTVDELCSLPGVGPKMAFLALQIAWNLNVGIGVDVHVHRITNRLGWHKPPTKNPEGTRLNLQSWLPAEYHPEINHMLVGFGQMVCLPVGPRCDQCQLSTAGLCPSAKKGGHSPKKRKVMVKGSPGPQIEIAVDVKEELLVAGRISETSTSHNAELKYEDIP